MSHVNFKWEVESVDNLHGSMVVKYTTDACQEGMLLNIPKPLAGASETEIHDHIGKYLPKPLWESATPIFADIEVGASGTSSVSLAPETSEMPNVIGSWNEEYIRAMVYLVLEEIRESEA